MTSVRFTKIDSVLRSATSCFEVIASCTTTASCNKCYTVPRPRMTVTTQEEDERVEQVTRACELLCELLHHHRSESVYMYSYVLIKKKFKRGAR